MRRYGVAHHWVHAYRRVGVVNIVVLIGIVITLATGIPVLLQILKTHPRGLLICFFAEMW